MQNFCARAIPGKSGHSPCAAKKSPIWRVKRALTSTKTANSATNRLFLRVPRSFCKPLALSAGQCTVRRLHWTGTLKPSSLRVCVDDDPSQTRRVMRHSVRRRLSSLSKKKAPPLMCKWRGLPPGPAGATIGAAALVLRDRVGSRHRCAHPAGGVPVPVVVPVPIVIGLWYPPHPDNTSPSASETHPIPMNFRIVSPSRFSPIFCSDELVEYFICF